MARLPNNKKEDISVDLSAAQTDATSEEQKDLAEQQGAEQGAENDKPSDENNGVTMDDSKVSMTTDKGDAVQNGTVKAGMVRIKLLHKHTCVVGGERYNFEKGKVYTVPPDVKRILSNAGLLTNL